MSSPYGLGLIETCVSCKSRTGSLFCDLSASTLQAFEAITFATSYPAGSVLFLEGEAPRGISLLCKGRVKLLTTSHDGKSLILRIADPGEVLGLGSAISGKPYGLTAETLEPCQVKFVTRGNFLRFLREHNDACFRAALELSDKYNSACREIRSLGLSHSAAEKLSRFLLECSSHDGQGEEQQPRLKLEFTHEEIAEMIGTSRETVTRLFAELKKRQIVRVNGPTLLICNRAALEGLALAI